METSPRVLAIIPAKAGSSRVPNKNTRILGGIPLFRWTVQSALAVETPRLDVWVSTDEGPAGDEIERLANDPGVTVIRRPPELCRDPAQLGDVVLHALDECERRHGGLPESVCALLPTSPFRSASQITEALTLHRLMGLSNVVSVSDGAWLREKVHMWSDQTLRMYSVIPDAAWVAVSDGPRFGPLFQGPHSSTLRMLNGAIWLATPERIRKDRMISPDGALPYVMDEETSLDVDTELDFAVAEAITDRRYSTKASQRCVA